MQQQERGKLECKQGEGRDKGAALVRTRAGAMLWHRVTPQCGGVNHGLSLSSTCPMALSMRRATPFLYICMLLHAIAIKLTLRKVHSRYQMPPSAPASMSCESTPLSLPERKKVTWIACSAQMLDFLHCCGQDPSIHFRSELFRNSHQLVLTIAYSRTHQLLYCMRTVSALQNTLAPGCTHRRWAQHHHTTGPVAASMPPQRELDALTLSFTKDRGCCCGFVNFIARKNTTFMYM